MQRTLLRLVRSPLGSDGRSFGETLKKVRVIQGTKVRNVRARRSSTNEAHKLQYVSAYLEAQSNSMQHRNAVLQRQAAVAPVQSIVGHSSLANYTSSSGRDINSFYTGARTCTTDFEPNTRARQHGLFLNASECLNSKTNMSHFGMHANVETSSIPFGAWRYNDLTVQQLYDTVDARVHYELHEATTPARLCKQALHRTIQSLRTAAPSVRALLRHLQRVCEASSEVSSSSAKPNNHLHWDCVKEECKFFSHYRHVMLQESLTCEQVSQDWYRPGPDDAYVCSAMESNKDCDIQLSWRRCLTSWCVLSLVEAGGWLLASRFVLRYLTRVLPELYVYERLDVPEIQVTEDVCQDTSRRDSVGKDINISKSKLTTTASTTTQASMDIEMNKNKSRKLIDVKGSILISSRISKSASKFSHAVAMSLLQEARRDVSQQVAVLCEAVRFASGLQEYDTHRAPSWHDVTRLYYQASRSLKCVYRNAKIAACNNKISGQKHQKLCESSCLYKVFVSPDWVKLLPIVAAPIMSLFIPTQQHQVSGDLQSSLTMQDNIKVALAQQRAALRHFVQVHVVHHANSARITNDTTTAEAAKHSNKHRRRCLPMVAWAAYLRALHRGGADLAEVQREVDCMTDELLTESSQTVLNSVHVWNAYLGCCFSKYHHPHHLDPVASCDHATKENNMHHATVQSDALKNATSSLSATSSSACAPASSVSSIVHRDGDESASTCTVSSPADVSSASSISVVLLANKHKPISDPFNIDVSGNLSESTVNAGAEYACDASTVPHVMSMYRVNMKHYDVHENASTVAAVMFALMQSSPVSFPANALSCENLSSARITHSANMPTPESMLDTARWVWCAFRTRHSVERAAGCMATASLCIAQVHLHFLNNDLSALLEWAVNYYEFWLFYGLSREWFEESGGLALSQHIKMNSIIQKTDSCTTFVHFFHCACGQCVHQVPKIVQHTWLRAIEALCGKTLKPCYYPEPMTDAVPTTKKSGPSLRDCTDSAMKVSRTSAEPNGLKTNAPQKYSDVSMTAEDLIAMM